MMPDIQDDNAHVRDRAVETILQAFWGSMISTQLTSSSRFWITLSMDVAEATAQILTVDVVRLLRSAAQQS